MSVPEGQKLDEPTVSPFNHLKQQIYKQFVIDINWSREKQFGQVPCNVAVKHLDRFLETLQILTSYQFGKVTFEGVIKMKTVLGFVI